MDRRLLDYNPESESFEAGAIARDESEWRGATDTEAVFGEADEMVPMPVCDQDGNTACTELRHPHAKLRRVTARIDDDGLGRGSLGPNDVAVRPDRSERKLVDAERHRFLCQLPRRPFDWSRRSARVTRRIALPVAQPESRGTTKSAPSFRT